jgi:hypothetical protein
MSLLELLQYLGTPAGLGALVTLLMYVIQRVKPSVQDDVAYALSVGLAAVVGIVAQQLVPFADNLPPEVIAVWPILIWAFNYLWFRLGPKRAMSQ